MMKLSVLSPADSVLASFLPNSAKMQVQVLLSASSAPAVAQYDVAKWKRLNALSAKGSLAVEMRRGFAVVYQRNCRKSLQIVRAVSETATEQAQRSRAESAASELNAKDLERARDEGLEQQQHLSSTAAAPFPPGSAFRELSFTDHHLVLLGLVACVMTGALSCLLLAAIPTLIAMKRAAESLGKLADTAREELPGTMAAVRLSGMEISDLTMELSDLGQEISTGVRNSSRAVRAAEDGLRRIGNFKSVGEGERAGGGREAGGGSRSKKYPRGTDASSQFSAQLDNSGPSV